MVNYQLSSIFAGTFGFAWGSIFPSEWYYCFIFGAGMLGTFVLFNTIDYFLNKKEVGKVEW